MKIKKITGYLILAVLAVASLGTFIYASDIAVPVIFKEASGDYITIGEMGFEDSLAFPVFGDNSTEENPDDKWVEIRNDKNCTLLVLDMSETYVDSDTKFLMVSKAYYEAQIKPVMENIDNNLYVTITEMGFGDSWVFPVFVDNSTEENPDDKWVEIWDNENNSLFAFDMAKTYIDKESGLLMVLKSYYESHIKPIVENVK